MKNFNKDILITVMFIIISVVLIGTVMPQMMEAYNADAVSSREALTVEPESVNIVYDTTEEINPYSPDNPLGDTSCFKNSAFVGNSHAEALKLYGMIPEADFYTRVGLTIETVIHPKDGSTPIINGLKGKKYDKVFLVFGENELGWPYTSVFVSRYETVINKVREYLPDADIYIQSIFPVSKEVSDKNINGINNDNVKRFNASIKEYAAETDGVYFINPAEAVTDKDGALPEKVSTDGLHFGPDYCKVWTNYLIDHINK